MNKNNLGKLALALAVLAVSALGASAQTDATTITTAINTAFVGVAGACVTIGTFYGVYRLVKRIK